MKQILQSFKTGKTELAELPAPKVKSGQVLIKTTRSLVSLGTERMLVEFGKASLIQKARQQPDKVKMVLDKIQAEGLMPTLETVFNKLEQPLPLGYCNVGEVVAVGNGVTDFKIGDRVASNGQHAEFVSVPQNLVAHIPDNITDEEASFTVIGSIGLQGIRLIKPTMGETIVVIGLGLIGLLTAEMLLANGCKVIGYDLDDTKVEIAKSKGVIAFNPLKGNDPVKFIQSETNNIGADGVVITASAKTNDIISQSAQMSRKRGRIVLVGVIGLDISRADFYEKELSFQVSCSYGPGRYDDDYEFKGIDYPLAFVRWTEKRNFETVLQLISTGKLKVKELISEVVPLEEYNKIYGDIGKSKSIASIIKYKEDNEPKRTIVVNKKETMPTNGGIGIIGAGNFTKMTVLPALKGTDANIKHIVSSGGVNGTALAQKHNITQSTTDYDLVLNDNEVDLVMITTRHNLHADMVIKALQKDKHVFVEKPLALNEKELQAIEEAYKDSKGTLMIGFNRRFSPHTQKIKSLVGSAPMNVVATMNAGAIPPNVWVHDIKIGGGRIIGEACHYLDLMVFLTGSKIKAVCMNALGENPMENTDNASILVKMENGSTGVVNYFANGAKSYSKERLEIFSQEKVLIMDNFIKTTGYGVKGFSKLKTRLDKGHKAQFFQIVEKIKQGSIEMIPYDELINVTKASFATVQSLKENKWIEIN
ncbi:bi-domain-containing oxidoreductase [Pasteurella skyensis]|uniref:Bi-domain-containing oxidoreductase n=1 Tax=Phocoenobacter skyensis TaxID=97481 RepID=A0AAJ6P0V6_9PAST|nr:bi-domain-containing oxidoreductase [Pasteurella skyensis]MDP8162124.1 bi-domain-containing oxidoreductase [Pasteurella skyensis]MDP8172983.1 bi-domain-containing oxidoreductase [Pasteurella skyensis]MDP8176750.1 bi-domain-containing oxidoreductase [Pasteurella skyensis]MDP8179492.1 bi-domain-containing oxidoreductase [Pasteurella skyensis]MDP8183654.1 bi-domain-containing oxidoreductase [Pasteurella skyensis]